MGTNILIIDDDILSVKALTYILENEGYLVTSINNGSEAFSMACDIKPDVILLDIILPGIDGFDICRLLKSDSELEGIPIIMITSKTDGYDLKRALELGAFDYIKKPIDSIETIARIQSALRFSQSQNRLREMATRDGLTGLYNHALLVELLDKELEKKKRKNGDLAFCMLDIDYFKKVNDTYGHLMGDKVLKDVSGILISMTRASDVIGRYGGEEFGIILPDIGKGNVIKLCERIRTKIEEFEFNLNGVYIRATISIGIYHNSSIRNIGSSEIIKNADEALYIAKHSGRNRVEIFKNNE